MANTKTQKTKTQEPKVTELEGGLKLKNLKAEEPATFNQCKALMRETGVRQMFWNDDPAITVAEANKLISGIRSGLIDPTTCIPANFTPQVKAPKKPKAQGKPKALDAGSLDAKIDLLTKAVEAMPNAIADALVKALKA